MGASADPAWPVLERWLAEATNAYELTRASPEVGEAALGALHGITERSVLGAMALYVESLRVDDWLVVLGAGGNGHPGISDFNGALPNVPVLPGALVVGVDVLGGAFAINGGGLPVGDLGGVCYLEPDTLNWLDCNMGGHSAFVSWALNGEIERFYEDLRWEDWRSLTSQLAPGRGISAYPFPWSEHGQGPNVSRRAEPLHEVYGILLSTVAQITGSGELPGNDGAT